MNPLTFVTHPSVRIKGTENNYSPSVCQDTSCNNKTPHMHCPFCVKSDSYQDPVILKAHYRVKHVDKGIEFAGLKVLRCCDHCDIVGVIKGEKKFKGAHWHCYKCRNGFNRRDEAIKHYKTHFRNPQTTFQIQIAQEVNQCSSSAADTTHSICSDQDIIHPALTQAACLATTDHTVLTSNGVCKTSDGTVQVSIAANETINAADGQTIMIISEEQLEAAQIENTFGTQIISTEDVSYLDPKQSLERKYESAEIRCQRLEEEKAQLKAELDQNRSQIQAQAEEINLYKRREQELLNQLQLTEQINMQDMLTSLQQQHKDLLSAQLASLRQAFITRLPQELVVSSNIVHISPDSYEIHINDEPEKVEETHVVGDGHHIVHIKQECAPKDQSVSENGVGAAGPNIQTTTELVSPCLVMCVEDESGQQNTDSTTDQNSLVIDHTQMDQDAANSAAALIQNGQTEVAGSQIEITEVLEESEPAKKRLRST
ncbi:uncharacterized protein LOC124138729 isoform X1 [Haliotis rufescens]|uniref:uncharacterized protein LOC124138729 isoform X1 n=1 Tax=Haliotis rufescens TaxID=6454 RepID=UPI001EB09794|nr:uncharacterized protein LOC124138729 isoform X1 [Haliotis rufescens]